ncbi:MAG: RNA polymerase sigma factor [Patescibacteria group bacterium]
MLDGEENIIESAVKGEALAFGLLYDYYQPRIYRFVLIKVSQREEAEDLTHQVFLSAWQNIATYRHRGYPFSSWLYRIARNQIIDFYRTGKKESRLDDIDPDYFITEARAEFDLDTKLQLGRVQQAIQKLKPEHQDVIIMRFIEEMSSKEVAAAIEKTEGAVKLIQHRALKQLRTFLES